MCPQELQRLGRAERKGEGRERKRNAKVQKDRLETSIRLRTKQILTQSSHRQLHRRAGRSLSKWNGDHRGKAESNLLALLETLFILSRAVFSTTPLSKSIQTHFQDKATSNLHRLFNQLRQISLQDNMSRLPNSAEITIQGTTWLIVPRKVSDHFFGQGERAKAQKGLSTLSLQVEKAQGSG